MEDLAPEDGDAAPLRAARPDTWPGALLAPLRRILPGGTIALLMVSAAFFVVDVAGDLADGASGFHTGLEAGMVCLLLLASGLLFRDLTAARERMARAEMQVRVAAGAFGAVIAERFADWGLSPAEREVALFSLKGLSVAEIAAVRGRAEGTVKAQLNAVYAKAGVSGRHQLLSLFIEDLLAEGLPDVS